MNKGDSLIHRKADKYRTVSSPSPMQNEPLNRRNNARPHPSNRTFQRPRLFALTSQHLHRRPNRAPERDDLHLLKIPHLSFTILVTLDPLAYRFLALRLDQHAAARHIRLFTILGMCRQGRAAKYHVSGFEVRLELF